MKGISARTGEIINRTGERRGRWNMPGVCPSGAKHGTLSTWPARSIRVPASASESTAAKLGRAEDAAWKYIRGTRAVEAANITRRANAPKSDRKWGVFLRNRAIRFPSAQFLNIRLLKLGSLCIRAKIGQFYSLLQSLARAWHTPGNCRGSPREVPGIFDLVRMRLAIVQGRGTELSSAPPLTDFHGLFSTGATPYRLLSTLS